MTGAAIVRWHAKDAIVLAVHGAFDGASAWSLRNEMDDSPAPEFVVNLEHAVEACEFAASLLADWARARRGTKRVRFVPGDAEHARLLAAFGLELLDPDDGDLSPVAAPFPWTSTSGAGVPA
jgi:hypothetical protein